MIRFLYPLNSVVAHMEKKICIALQYKYSIRTLFNTKPNI